MKQKINDLINFLIESGYCREDNIYTDDRFGLIYYYDVNGNIDGKYFDVVFAKYESRGGDFVTISHNTECYELIKWLLIEFKIT